MTDQKPSRSLSSRLNDLIGYHISKMYFLIKQNLRWFLSYGHGFFYGYCSCNSWRMSNRK